MDNSSISEKLKIVVVLRRIARVSAWLLLVVIVLLIITGWGITHTGIIYNATFGLVDRGLADTVHKVINLPLSLFFLIHVLINVRLRIQLKNPQRAVPVNIFFIVTGVLLLSMFVYVEYFG